MLKEGDYRLPGSDAHEAAAVRLNIQHYLVKDLFDQRLLDESIPYQKPNLRIADVSCGTGVWLLDLLPHCHATTQFFALDLNTAQLPPSPWLPPRITPVQYNLFQDDLPAGLEAETFDIVNISVVFSFVKDDRVDAVLRNLLRLLKPGGHLQWTELDGANSVGVSPRPQSHQSPAIPRFAQDIWPLLGERCAAWPDRLDAVLEAQGLREVRCRRPPPKLEKLKMWMQEYLMVHKEISDLFANTCGPCRQSQEAVRAFRELLDQARVEAQQQGTAMWVPVVRAVGRKPE